MEELYNLGIGDNTLKSMMELYPNLNELSKEEIIEKEQLLEKIGCSRQQILNIISSNVMYLDRTTDEIIELITFFKKLGFNTLNILFDSNPYILNMEIFEIENYINKRIKNHELLEDIIDDLDSNPYLFTEM